jgi:diguanylate cyclase (GGDEF)-like protein
MAPSESRGTAVRLALAGALAGALLAPPAATALDPAKRVGHYTHQVWQTEQGLLQSRVNAVVQSQDGYLWLGTLEGVARFDGVRFVSLNRRTEPRMTDNRVRAIAEDRGGALWIGTEKGLNRLAGGELTPFGLAEGMVDEVVWAIAPDPAGGVWVGTEGGLHRIVGDEVGVVAAGGGLTSDRIQALLVDRRDGALWVGTADGGVNRLEHGAVTAVYTVDDGLSSNEISTLFVDRAGRLWVGSQNGTVDSIAGGRVTPHPLPVGGFRISAILEDRDGNLWIGGPALVRLSGGRAEVFDEPLGLSNNQVLSLTEDREGSLWIGTHGGGLNRLKDGKFVGYSTTDGLSHTFVKSVACGGDGAIWIGTYGGGLDRLDPATDAIVTYSAADGLATDLVRTIAEGPGGALWVGTTNGLSRLAGGRIDTFTTDDGLAAGAINSLAVDSRGDLWIATGSGLVRRHHGAFTTLTVADGLASDQVSAVFEDRDGVLWVGTYGAGLSRIEGDGRITRMGAAEGLSGLTVLAFYQDADGTVWIGTADGGLGRYRDGRLTAVTTAQGLDSDVVFQIVEDDLERLWLASANGVMRVDRRELDRLAAGEIDRVTAQVFGAPDGMPSGQCSGGSTPNACRAPDGRLWFATSEGLAAIDPARIRTNPLPPPVVVEQVRVGETVARPGGDGVFDLSPGASRLEIDYTALSFLLPERVRFRYRLEGFDDGWVDAGARRTAYYTNLPPGRYRFRVIASNGDGVWNRRGATVELGLEPRFWQTWWFAVLVGVVVLGLVGGSYRMRVSQLERRDRELVELVAERTRRLEEEKERSDTARRQAEELRQVAEARGAELADKAAELELVNRKLEALSQSDGLTGVANRRRFNTVLDAEWRRAVRGGTPLSLVLFDVDQFKAINDTWGHPEADRCLQQVAEVLQGAVRRAADLVARYGGDEFAIMLPDTDGEAACALAEDIRRQVEELGTGGDTTPHGKVTISAGVATLSPETPIADVDGLVRAADQALYRSKREGRNRVGRG